MRRVQIATKVLPSQVEELDQMISEKYPGHNRSDLLRVIIEKELVRQRDGNSKDARLERVLQLCQDIHKAIIK